MSIRQYDRRDLGRLPAATAVLCAAALAAVVIGAGLAASSTFVALGVMAAGFVAIRLAAPIAPEQVASSWQQLLVICAGFGAVVVVRLLGGG